MSSCWYALALCSQEIAVFAFYTDSLCREELTIVVNHSEDAFSGVVLFHNEIIFTFKTFLTVFLSRNLENLHFNAIQNCTTNTGSCVLIYYEPVKHQKRICLFSSKRTLKSIQKILNKIVALLTCHSKASIHQISPVGSCNSRWNSFNIYLAYQEKTNPCIKHKFLGSTSCRSNSLQESHEECKMICWQKDKTHSCKQHILLSIKPEYPWHISHSFLQS